MKLDYTSKYPHLVYILNKCEHLHDDLKELYKKEWLSTDNNIIHFWLINSEEYKKLKSFYLSEIDNNKNENKSFNSSYMSLEKEIKNALNQINLDYKKEINDLRKTTWWTKNYNEVEKIKNINPFSFKQFNVKIFSQNQNEYKEYVNVQYLSSYALINISFKNLLQI